MKQGRSFVLLVGILAVWGALSRPAAGGGFALLQQGTAAMAQGNAFVAQADDPTAIFYNPAGLTQLKQPEVYLGQVFNFPDREYHGPGASETKHSVYFTPTVYVSVPITSRLVAGLGYFAPFGMGTNWPPGWTGRFLTTSSHLKTYNVNPALAFQVLDNLSVAAGLNVMWSTVQLKRHILLPNRAEGEQQLDGHGQGLGYNLGVLWEPLEGLKLGAAFRSEITISYHTSLKATFSPDIGGKAPLTLPPSVTFGASWSRFRPLCLEIDATWTGWSTYDQLRLDLHRPTLVNGALSYRIVQPKNWDNAWAIRFGANYEIISGLKVRAGYIYDMTPVPDATFDPQVPDANRHIFTLGGDWRISRFTLGLAYNYIMSESRTKNNLLTLNGVPYPVAAQANGRYESDTHSVGLSMSTRF